MQYFPQPNFDSGTRFNYQVPIVGATHTDNIQARVNRSFNVRNSIAGEFGFQRTASDSPNVFAFLDKSHTKGMNAAVNYVRRIGQRASVTLRYQFSRLTTSVDAALCESLQRFRRRRNHRQQPGTRELGSAESEFSPVALPDLSDGQSALNRNQTQLVWYFRCLESRSAQLAVRRRLPAAAVQPARRSRMPRGTFTFTGAATGSDFADFLLGIPTTSSIAFGNADKYFRQSVYDAFCQR